MRWWLVPHPPNGCPPGHALQIRWHWAAGCRGRISDNKTARARKLGAEAADLHDAKGDGDAPAASCGLSTAAHHPGSDRPANVALAAGLRTPEAGPAGWRSERWQSAQRSGPRPSTRRRARRPCTRRWCVSHRKVSSKPCRGGACAWCDLTPQDIAESPSSREALEVEVVRLALARASDDDLAALQPFVVALEQHALDRDGLLGIQRRRRRAPRCARRRPESAPATKHQRPARLGAAHSVRCRRATFGSAARPRKALAEHKQLVRAVQQRNAAAEGLIRDHIGR